jgi:hypothetical protein
MANTSPNLAVITAKTSTVSNSNPIANVETYITSPMLLISGNTSNGDCFRIMVAGKRYDTDGFYYTYNVKVGTAGTVADQNILSVPGIRNVGDGKQTFFDEFVVTIRANGASGNALCVATNSGNPVIGGNVAYNSTTNNYIGLTFAASDKYANVIFTTAVTYQII